MSAVPPVTPSTTTTYINADGSPINLAGNGMPANRNAPPTDPALRKAWTDQTGASIEEVSYRGEARLKVSHEEKSVDKIERFAKGVGFGLGFIGLCVYKPLAVTIGRPIGYLMDKCSVGPAYTRLATKTREGLDRLKNEAWEGVSQAPIAEVVTKEGDKVTKTEKLKQAFIRDPSKPPSPTETQEQKLHAARKLERTATDSDIIETRDANYILDDEGSGFYIIPKDKEGNEMVKDISHKVVYFVHDGSPIEKGSMTLYKMVETYSACSKQVEDTRKKLIAEGKLKEADGLIVVFKFKADKVSVHLQTNQGPDTDITSGIPVDVDQNIQKRILQEIFSKTRKAPPVGTKRKKKSTEHGLHSGSGLGLGSGSAGSASSPRVLSEDEDGTIHIGRRDKDDLKRSREY